MARLLPLLIYVLASVVHSVPAPTDSGTGGDPNEPTPLETVAGGFTGALNEFCAGCVTSCNDPTAIVPGNPPTRVTRLGQRDGLHQSFSPPLDLHECADWCTAKFRRHASYLLRHPTKSLFQVKDGLSMAWRLNRRLLSEGVLEMKCEERDNQPQGEELQDVSYRPFRDWAPGPALDGFGSDEGWSNQPSQFSTTPLRKTGPRFAIPDSITDCVGGRGCSSLRDAGAKRLEDSKQYLLRAFSGGPQQTNVPGRPAGTPGRLPLRGLR